MITIFATPTCPKCKTLRTQMETQGNPPNYMMVGEDITKEQLQVLVGREVKSVPVVVEIKEVY